MDFTIREENPQDYSGIRVVNEQAFGETLEARLVDSLRANKAVLISLVAVSDTQIVGHILFSPVQIEIGDSVLEGVGLGPMSVLPDFQRKGIGSTLIESGIQMIRQRGSPFIVVLGHPNYYQRFGFVPASRYSLKCQWDVPDDVFMILPLDPPRLEEISGLARYREEFSTVT